MLLIHNVILVMTHFGYYAVVDFVVEIGDHYVTHLVTVIVLQVGMMKGAHSVAKYVHKRRTLAPHGTTTPHVNKKKVVKRKAKASK